MNVNFVLLQGKLWPVFVAVQIITDEPYWIKGFFFLRRSFALVTQAGVQWRDLGLPQPHASWVQAILLPQPPE